MKAFRRGQLNNFAQLTMPYLAGFVGPGHQVTLVDEYNDTVDLEGRWDLVAITCNTPNARHVYQLSAELRSRGSTVVLGGPHVSLLPDEAAEHADAIVVGEAEHTWPELLRDAERGRLARIYRSEEAPSLEGLPIARRDLIRRRPLLGCTIIATRGCPHRCRYCNLRQIYHDALRFRPVAEVVEEVRGFRSPFFAFWDDQLFMNRTYAQRLFQALEGLGRRWAAMVTPASAQDDQLLAAAARAGCSCLFLGLESISTGSLKGVGKGFNRVVDYGDIVGRIHRHGLLAQAGIVFGFDGDDPGIFERTLDEARRIGIDGATVSILTPFPGSPLFEELESEGRLLTHDWSYFNGKTAVTFRPRRMDPAQLWEGYRWFRRRFFSRREILRRCRRSGVSPLTSLALNWGYRRTLTSEIPGHPLPGSAPRPRGEGKTELG
ncbi:MAG: radical SAM protein [Deltaproteobacteria bacterium]|nr:radical SAM protein [Deltaproteobacteria bacterium]